MLMSPSTRWFLLSFRRLAGWAKPLTQLCVFLFPGPRVLFSLSSLLLYSFSYKNETEHHWKTADKWKNKPFCIQKLTAKLSEVKSSSSIKRNCDRVPRWVSARHTDASFSWDESLYTSRILIHHVSEWDAERTREGMRQGSRKPFICNNCRRFTVTEGV